MQLKSSSVMFRELSDGCMTSPCSSLTPIRCFALTRFSFHPQTCSCPLVQVKQTRSSSWKLGSASEKQFHSSLLLFCCPCIPLAAPLLLSRLLFLYGVHRSLSTGVSYLCATAAAAASVLPCLAGPNLNPPALADAKSHGLLLSPGPG